MALRKRGGKPEPEEEEEDLEEGEEEGAAEGEEEGEEAAEEEGGEEESEGEGEEAAGEEDKEEEEGEDEEDEEEDEEEVSTKSRRGPAAKGSIKDKPVMDGYTWMTVLTCCLFITAIIVQMRDHSVHWRMGVAMDGDPIRTTTHFNAQSEDLSEAKGVAKFGDPINTKSDRFGQDVMEYQEVTAADAADYPKLKKRVQGAIERGPRPSPNLGELPEAVEPLVPLTGLSAVQWTMGNLEAAPVAPGPLGGDGAPPPADAATPPVVAPPTGDNPAGAAPAPVAPTATP